MRSLGGSIGLAICVIVFNKQIRSTDGLTSALTADQLSALLKSPLTIASFTPQQKMLVAQVFANAFTQEMRVAMYIAAASFVVSLLTWQKTPPSPLSQRGPPPPLPSKTEPQEAEAGIKS